MNVLLSVRSDVAFQYLTKVITADERLVDWNIRERNVTTTKELEDAIEFFNPDLIILDEKVEEHETLLQLAEQAPSEVFIIEGEVQSSREKLVERYGVAGSEQDEDQEIYYEKEEKEKVVIQEKIIEKEVIRTAYQAIPSKVIVVGSLYKGAGSTTLATNIARMVGGRGIDTAYIEHPLVKPYMFDYLQMHSHNNKDYIDLSREIHRDGFTQANHTPWIYKGVRWNVIDSREPSLNNFTYENLLVLIHSIPSNVLIIDISDRWLDPEVQKLLPIASNIVLSVEPDPIKYDWSLYDHPGYRTRERQVMDQLANFDHYDIVLMKYIKGIDIKLVKGMLHKKPIANLPYLKYQDIQRALFNSTLLYDFESYDEVFEDNLIPLISKFIPRDFVELENRKSKGLTNLFKIGKK